MSETPGRILSDERVHLRLVGTQLVFASVLLVHEFVLVVLVHIHSPKAGGHGALRHVCGGLGVWRLSDEEPNKSSNLAFFVDLRLLSVEAASFRLLFLADICCSTNDISLWWTTCATASYCLYIPFPANRGQHNTINQFTYSLSIQYIHLYTNIDLFNVT